MFKKRQRSPGGKQGMYKNQVDDDEAEGGGQQMEMGRAAGSTKAGTHFNASGERGSARGSISLYRSDINSDYVINNAYGIQDDLEHVNLVQQYNTNEFIRRVYLIFTAQMVFSTCLVGLCAHSPGLMQVQAENFYLFWIALGCYVICDVCLLTRRELSRREPTNYLILLAATLCQGYILSQTCRTYTPECVFMVFLIATSAFAGMTLYGLAARRDIGVKGSIGAALLAAGLALAIILTQFEKSDIIYISFCCIFVFAAIVFVAIDTQMILKEKRYGIT